MERLSNVITRKDEPAFVVTPDPVVPVRFPTAESWQEFLLGKGYEGPSQYCKYGCGGAEYFRRDVPVGHPLFGKSIPCQCLKEKQAQTDEQRIAAYRETLSTTEQTFTLDNWVGTDLKALAAARKAVSQGWGMFVFWGDVGRAKSGLLAGIVNECLDHKLGARYAVAPEMLDDLRASYERDEFDQEFNYLKGAKVLALDEFMRHKPTPWAEEKMFQLIDYRYRYWDRLLTVVATNARPDANDPLWSRFSDAQRSQIIQVTGADVRPMA